MKVAVDLGRCSGCGTCEALCPDVVAVGDDGSDHVLVDDCAPWTDAAVEAAESCPDEAIVVDAG